MKTSPKTCVLVAVAALATIGALSGTGPMMLGGSQAHAIIGRPLTPMSYAGVARRTTRRAYRRGAYGGAYGGAYAAPYAAPYAGYGAGYAAGAAAATVTTLPGGCVRMPGPTVMYQCGATHYQPFYSGPTVVYQPVP